VSGLPQSDYFKPRGVPLTDLEEVVLTVDEFEAVRLADYRGLYHESAARLMGISRQTFGRIIESARKKVSEALIKGRALKIEGGNYQMVVEKRFICSDCQFSWTVSHRKRNPSRCPLCRSKMIQRSDKKTNILQPEKKYSQKCSS
jgi:predicted DNA-binding protein (UPF0251 family)